MHKQKKTHLNPHFINFILLFLIITLSISVYTFILQKNFSHNTLEATIERNIQCSEAIRQLVSEIFNKEDFTKLDSIDNMSTNRYKELQSTLNRLRTLNSTRYLYTATRNDEGKLIYVVDGLDLDATDFAYPGSYIEDEMIPYISTALEGETIYSQDIIDTTWGHIFTACYPIRDDNTNEIIGALCLEMDMESSYRFIAKNNKTTLLSASTAIFVSIILAFYCYIHSKKIRDKEEQQKKLLEQVAKKANLANQAKSTFLFNISHDIRTPMNAILGYATLASRHLQEPESLNDYINKITICGNRLLSILDSVLELARIENSDNLIEENIVNIDEAIDSCLIMFENELNAKQQTLIITKNITYPYIYLDNTHMNEIILNILSNAIKYTGTQGKIEFIYNQIDEKDNWCTTEVIIKDNGIGMSPTFQQHIFESFSRERNSTISGIEGTGLGMGIVKKLVDAMHGTINVESQVGKGSTFTVHIPTRIASKEEALPKRAITPLNPEPLINKRILLVEDNDLNAEIAIELLSEPGLIVDWAKNGVEGVEAIEKAPANYYTLILMDIQMPIMNGYLASQKIRKLDDPKKASIPIIAMTANAFSEDKQKALESGMNEHVAKPIDMNTLIPILIKYTQKL